MCSVSTPCELTTCCSWDAYSGGMWSPKWVTPCSSTHLYTLRPFDCAAPAEEDVVASSKRTETAQARFFKNTSPIDPSHCGARAAAFLGANSQLHNAPDTRACRPARRTAQGHAYTA